MIIKELNLIGFGKFQNKVMELNEGINIIYGENEAGKSTIHSFINGMFYGFLKPYAKKTIYLEEHEKYNPWQGSRYGGIIRFSYEGRNYRIEREFTKGSEETKVFLEDTGENITNYINNGDMARIPQPGFQFFGFNNVIFTNTVMIKQLGSKTDSSLANEVREKIINVSTAMDDSVSIEKALLAINNGLKDIGSLNATTKQYFQLNSRLQSLIEEKKEISSLKEEYVKLLDENNILSKELEVEERNLSDLRLRLNKAEILEKKKIFEEATVLSQSIDELNTKLRELKPFEILSMEDYSEGIRLQGNIANLKEKKEGLCSQLGEIEAKIKELESNNCDHKDFYNDNISDDYLQFEELEDEKNKIFYSKNNTGIELLKRDFESLDNNRKRTATSFLGSLIVVLGLFGYLLISKNYFLIIPIIPVIILGIFTFIKLNNIKSRLSEIRLSITKEENKEKLKEERIEEIESIQRGILNKHNVKSKVELKALFNNIQLNIYKKNEHIQKLNESRGMKEDALAKISQYDTELDMSNRKLNLILSNNFSANLEEFKIGLEKKNLHEDTLIQKENKVNLLKMVLGKFTLEELQTELELYKENHIYEEKSKDELKEMISVSIENISSLKIMQKGIEEKLNILNSSISRLVEVDEEILRKKERIEELDKKKDALELAKETISELSKEIHSQFAPHINKVVGDIIKEITNDRYNTVKIDNNLDISVINPKTREIIALGSLSGGTIDQIYFALRLGITNSMVRTDLPIILDDCFVQYDNNRLNNILEYLLNIIKGRQVLLFTCHNREIDLLKKKGADFNLITLA